MGIDLGGIFLLSRLEYYRK